MTPDHIDTSSPTSPTLSSCMMRGFKRPRRYFATWVTSTHATLFTLFIVKRLVGKNQTHETFLCSRFQLPEKPCPRKGIQSSHRFTTLMFCQRMWNISRSPCVHPRGSINDMGRIWLTIFLYIRTIVCLHNYYHQNHMLTEAMPLQTNILMT